MCLATVPGRGRAVVKPDVRGGGAALCQRLALKSWPLPGLSEEGLSEEDSDDCWEEGDQQQLPQQLTEPDVEELREGAISIVVSQSEGFLCHIQASARLPLPAVELYKQVITHPSNERIFRHMVACTHRQVLADDGCGRRRLEVEQRALWRMLVFSGTFTTRLLVDEDDTALSMRFELKYTGRPHGLLRRFRGMWRVRPDPQDPSHACIATLDQDLSLAISLPPPFTGALKTISSRQVRSIFQDIQREAGRVAAGRPSLPPWRVQQVGAATAGGASAA